MTGLSVLYANQAMKERGWADIPDRNKVSRLREMYWLKVVKPLGPKSNLKMQLYWRPDQGELGRRADMPGDGFAYVATMFPSAEGRSTAQSDAGLGCTSGENGAARRRSRRLRAPPDSDAPTDCPARRRRQGAASVRRPSAFTLLIVRSRAPDRAPRRDNDAVLVGGTTTLVPRAPAAP